MRSIRSLHTHLDPIVAREGDAIADGEITLGPLQVAAVASALGAAEDLHRVDERLRAIFGSGVDALLGGRMLMLQDDDDREILLGALATSYTWTLDALGACLLHNGRPLKQPHHEAARRNRAAADRLERLLAALGARPDAGRREDIERLARC